MVPPEASRQCGAFTRRQALDAGTAPGTISSRLARGRWQQLLPRVYAAAGPVGAMTRSHAALLWLPGGTVSHLAAAWLWALLDEPDVVHLTVPAGCTRRSPHEWLRLVRRDVPPCERWELRGLPVVPPERAILDCAAVLGRSAAARLFDRALDGRLNVPELRDRYWADLGRRGSHHAYRQLVAAAPAYAACW